MFVCGDELDVSFVRPCERRLECDARLRLVAQSGFSAQVFDCGENSWFGRQDFVFG